MPFENATVPAPPIVLLFVPPLAIGNIPVTSELEAKFTCPVDNTPAALFLTMPAVLNCEIVTLPEPLSVNELPAKAIVVG